MIEAQVNPFSREWHEINPSPRIKQLQARYGLSSRATALIQGLVMASRFSKEIEFEEAMAIYLSELESEIVDARLRHESDDD